jgi:hypothetical protein
MHQSVVEFEIVPAALTAMPSPTAGPGSPHRGFRDLRRAALVPAGSEGAAPEFARGGGMTRFSSYVIAAGIAAGLIAAWAGLCII